MYCHLMSILDVSFCSNLTDEAIKAIAANCPALTDLNIDECRSLTDAAVVAIAANCPKLTSLKFGSSTAGRSDQGYRHELPPAHVVKYSILSQPHG